MYDGETRKGAPACGLWLRVGPDLAPDVLVRDLNQIFYVINRSPYEKNMHALEIFGDHESEKFREAAGHLFAFARGKGIATIFRGPAAMAKTLEADGVLLQDVNDIAAAKELFGEKGIVGLACALSQEASLAAYDAGADFVTFGGPQKMPGVDVMKMWTILTDRPAVVEGPVTNDYCAYYVAAGAGFIDAADYIWSHPKGVMQGAVNMLHAIDLALADKAKDSAAN